MKKILILGIMLMTGLSIIHSLKTITKYLIPSNVEAFASEQQLQWSHKTCPDCGVHYAICLYGGDGEPCNKWGERTRKCKCITGGDGGGA